MGGSDKYTRFHHCRKKWVNSAVIPGGSDCLQVLVFSVLLAYAQYRWKKISPAVRIGKRDFTTDTSAIEKPDQSHFLFNALNSLNALISTEPVLAKEFVLNLSKLYRYVLEKRNDNLVPVREEVEFIRYYFFLQKIRFKE